MTRDYLIMPDDIARADLPGGSGLYACIGLKLWDEQISLLSRISPDYPQQWLTQIQHLGIDMGGIQVAAIPFHQETFQAIKEWENVQSDNPILEYANRKLPIPPALNHWLQDQYQNTVSHSPFDSSTLQIRKIPAYFQDASSILLMPMDEKEQQMLLDYFHQDQFPHAGLFPAASWMMPNRLGELIDKFSGIRTLFTTLTALKKLFSGITQDTWEMTEALAECLDDAVIILNGFSGGFLFCKQNRKRYSFPMYPFSRRVNPIGCDAAFCGGYTAGQRLTYDPIESIVYGSISASIVLEGSNPFSAMAVLPELKSARLQPMRKLIKTV